MDRIDLFPFTLMEGSLSILFQGNGKIAHVFLTILMEGFLAIVDKIDGGISFIPVEFMEGFLSVRHGFQGLFF